VEDYEPTELCDGCFFQSFCIGINLPHCNGEDFVQDRLNKQD
jgi:hypothetical protein